MRFIYILSALLISSTGYAQSQCANLFKNAPEKKESYALAEEQRLNFIDFYQEMNTLKSQKNKGVVVKTAAIVDGLPVMMATLQPAHNPKPKKVLITSGVHGSEVISILNSINLFKKLIDHPQLREKFEFTFVFNINNSGLKNGTRKTDTDVDLNRHWTDTDDNKTIQTLLSVLNRKFTADQNKADIDLFLDLHDALPKQDYFIIKSDPQDLLPEAVVAQLPADYFIESQSGHYPEFLSSAFAENSYELLAPGVTTSINQGTFKTYWHQKGVQHAYTFEAPGQVSRQKNLEISEKILLEFLERF